MCLEHKKIWTRNILNWLKLRLSKSVRRFTRNVLGLLVLVQPSDGRHAEVLERVLGIDSVLQGPAANPDVRLGQRQRVAVGAADHLEEFGLTG